MVEGTLKVNLSGTTTQIEEAKGWFGKLIKNFTGAKEADVEAITQMQYIEKISAVLKGVGLTNAVSMDVNGSNVYYDDEDKEDDLQEAMSAALEAESKDIFHVSLEMEAVTEEQEPDCVTVNMYNKHEANDEPIVISIDSVKSHDDIVVLLNKVKEQIEATFKTDDVIIDIDEDYEDDPEEDDPEEDDPEEDDPEEDNDPEEDKDPEEKKE